MSKINFKNIILLVMVFICIYLSSNVWLQLPGFTSRDNVKEKPEIINEADILKVLKPVKNIIKYNDNYAVLYSDENGLWQKALVEMENAFNDYSNLSITEIGAFPAQYLKFDFKSDIPAEIFTGYMEIDNKTILNTVKDIKNVIIDLDNTNSIYIYNGENTIKFTGKKINTMEIANVAKSYDFESKIKYAFSQKVGDETLQVPVPLEQTALNTVFVQSELDVFDTKAINEIAKNYFRQNYDYVRKSVEVSGNLVYVYRTEKILKINEEGLLEFYDAAAETEDESNVYKSFVAAINFTKEFLGFPENGYLSSVENINLEGNDGYRYTFSYNILERPILFSKVRENSALQIDVIGNKVVSYKRFIRNINEQQMDKMTNTKVLPAVDVISKNIDTPETNEAAGTPQNTDADNTSLITELKPIKKEMIKDINNIYLGYFDLSRILKEQVLRVVWVVETNEKTLIFNAITGALIEEW